MNIGNAVTRWWTGNRTLTNDQREAIVGSRIKYFEDGIRPTLPSNKRPPRYRSTIIGSTFAERQIEREAARQTVRQDQEKLPPSSTNNSSFDNTNSTIREEKIPQTPRGIKEQSKAAKLGVETALLRLQRIKYFEDGIRPTLPSNKRPPRYRSTIIGSTFAERQIEREAARQTVRQDQEKLPPSSTNNSSFDNTNSTIREEKAKRGAEAALLRLQKQSTPANNQASSSRDVEETKSPEKATTSSHRSYDLGQPLLDRIGEISHHLDSLSQEIETQKWKVTETNKNFEEANEKFAQLVAEQLEQSEQHRTKAKNTSASLISEQNYEYQQAVAEDLFKILKKNQDQLTTLQQHHSHLEQQLGLLSQVHSAMHPVQNRLTTLEDDYKKLATSTDKRVERGNKLLQYARIILTNLVNSTRTIANEPDLNTMLAQVANEDSSTQVEKANDALNKAQDALGAVQKKA